MGLAENRAKSAAMSKYLAEQGYPHGKRRSKPNPNSGGTTMVMHTTGSAKYQRLQAAKQGGKVNRNVTKKDVG